MILRTSSACPKHDKWNKEYRSLYLIGTFAASCSTSGLNIFLHSLIENVNCVAVEESTSVMYGIELHLNLEYCNVLHRIITLHYIG